MTEVTSGGCRGSRSESQESEETQEESSSEPGQDGQGGAVEVQAATRSENSWLHFNIILCNMKLCQQDGNLMVALTLQVHSEPVDRDNACDDQK